MGSWSSVAELASWVVYPSLVVYPTLVVFLSWVVYPSVSGAAVFSNLILKLRFPILAHPSESWDIYMYVCIHI